jgi:dolichyl-phosphate beta-glucosyltransferase
MSFSNSSRHPIERNSTEPAFTQPGCEQNTSATPLENELELSVVLPAYNESKRLPPYLDEIRRYMDEQYARHYEVIVVDDGSSDHLDDKISTLAQCWPELRLLRHPANVGKGAAVRTGILAANGARILFADADGATPIDQEQRLRQALKAGFDLAVGSRMVDAPDVVCHRRWSRKLIGKLFAGVVRRVISPPVRDTQCGFKLFRAEPGKRLFRCSKESGYLFDIEILTMAQILGYQIAEIPIDWSERPGSRLNLLRQCPKIMVNLWCVRQRLAGGISAME